MDQREKRKRNVKIGGRIASGGHCRLDRNEQILTAIRPVINYQNSDRSRLTIMNYQTKKRIIDYHEEFEQAQIE